MTRATYEPERVLDCELEDFRLNITTCSYRMTMELKLDLSERRRGTPSILDSCIWEIILFQGDTMIQTRRLSDMSQIRVDWKSFKAKHTKRIREAPVKRRSGPAVIKFAKEGFIISG